MNGWYAQADVEGNGRALGFVALTFASINIFGGFLVTKRMLAMFQRKQK